MAFSGGRDSTALLHATCASARAHGVCVVALHVDHGLQEASGDWARRLARRVAGWRRRGWPVRFVGERLAGAPGPGESVEAWAREARYRALTRMAQAAGCGTVLLAHHRRDQAETVLLQALRRAGPAGLAAMPARLEHQGIVWLRPWLAQSPEAIAAYALRHRLRWIDDPSNADARHDRNRLRHAVWPALLQAFPQAEAALAAVAMRQAEAAELIDSLAHADLQALGCAAPTPAGAARIPAEPVVVPPLDVVAWRRLPPVRRPGVLRAWLRAVAGPGPALRGPALQRLLQELPTARAGARWLWPGLTLLLHRGRLQPVAVEVEPGMPPHVPGSGVQPSWPAPPGLQRGRPGEHRLPPGLGILVARRTDAGGVALERLRGATLRLRQAGDQFQAGPGRPARALKKQFQAAGLHALQREGPVMCDAQGRLIWVAGLGVDAAARASAGEAQLALEWRPASAAAAATAGLSGS